jgi:hypothetical protein
MSDLLDTFLSREDSTRGEDNRDHRGDRGCGCRQVEGVRCEDVSKECTPVPVFLLPNLNLKSE